MRSIKGQYFLGYAVLGSVAPFASVFLASRGLDKAQIGLIASIGGVSTLLMPALMSALADLKLENRVLLRGAFTGLAVALGWMLFSHGFWWLVPPYLLWTLSQSPLMSLTDGLLFGVRSLRDAEGVPTPPYHRIRVYGTLGFIAPSFVLYWLLSGEHNPPVSLALGVGLVVALLTAANTFLLPHTRGAIGEPRPAAEVPDPHPAPRGGKSLPTVLAFRRMLQPDVAVFCVSMWLIWIATSTYYTFYPLYLVEVVGVADKWLGLISSIGVVLEIGYVLAFGWLLRKVGVKGVFAMGLAAATLRTALLWAFPSLAVALGTQVLHGLTVLGIFVLPPLYLNHRADAPFRNSMQGLYAMLVTGTGSMTGNILSGQVSEAFGGDVRIVFGVTAVCGLAAMGLFGLLFRDRGDGPLEP